MDVSEQQNFARAPSAECIAQLNDKFRKTGRGGQVVVTRGITTLAGFHAAELMTALAKFESFDEANDPHGEHDFGGVDMWGAEILWKIDYYDNDLANASPNPADESLTTRVLTVMLAEEY